MFFTDDPVRDYERWDEEQARAEAARDYIVCDGKDCRCKIYREDDVYEGDHFYETPDGNFCEDCAEKWLETFRMRLT